MKFKQVMYLLSDESVTAYIAMPSFIRSDSHKSIPHYFYIGNDEALHYLDELHKALEKRYHDVSTVEFNIATSMSDDGYPIVIFLPYTAGPLAN